MQSIFICILWRKSTSGRCVDHQNYLSTKSFQREFLTILFFYCEIINIHNKFSFCFAQLNCICQEVFETYSHLSSMTWGIHYVGYSAPASTAFLVAVPFAIAIMVCAIISVYFEKECALAHSRAERGRLQHISSSRECASRGALFCFIGNATQSPIK